LKDFLKGGFLFFKIFFAVWIYGFILKLTKGGENND